MTVDRSLQFTFEQALQLREDQRRSFSSTGGGGSSGGGIGPLDPGAEQRIATLETDFRSMRSSLERIELRLEHLGSNVATKADLAGTTGSVGVLTERIAGLDKRIGSTEAVMGTALNAAIGKSIGPVQLPMIVAACLLVIGGAFAAFGWAAAHH